MIHFFAAVLLLVASYAPAQSAAPNRQEECRTWQECRTQALAAAERGEFELFHDLAWLSFRKGPPNNPDLMTMLARAQSLSGRPHDALVMLRRIASLGAVPAGTDHEDFERVRELPGWPELDARIRGIKSPPPSNAPAPSTVVAPTTGDPAAPATSAKPSGRADSKAAGSGSPDKITAEATEAVRFVTDPSAASGLAYDSVSNRFIVSDRRERKLSVIGERSQRVSNFVGPESAGFGEIDAVAIDAHEGDLWVASTGTDDAIGARLHKLQLISGRQLASEQLPAGTTGARLIDLAIAGDGTVFALDGSGSRLFRFDRGTARGGGLQLATALELPRPVSIALVAGFGIYVAHADGVSIVNLQSKSVRPLKGSRDVVLSGLTWIRMHHGSLIGIQKNDDGTSRIVRIRLAGGGTSANRLWVLQANVPLGDQPVAVISGDALYYLTIVPAPSGPTEIVIRRIALD